MKHQLLFFLYLSLLHLSSCQFPQLSHHLRHPLFSRIPIPLNPSKNLKNNPSITEVFIRQPIDHFNPQDTRSFAQYFVRNDEFSNGTGPFFIFMFMFPFFSSLAENYLVDGPVHDLAREFNGTVVVPHHRYFDKSRVFQNLTTENLRFLSINQALEDLARIIVELTRGDANNPVILVGWDYGASMATWFAQKYPHLVTGIWAAGAKLHPGFNQTEPVRMVEQQLREFGSAGCVEKIQNAFDQIDEMITNNQSHVLRRRFNLCFPIPYQNGDLDIYYLLNILSVHFYSYSLVFDENYIVDYSCGTFMNAPVEHDWEALGYILGLMSLPFPICYPNSFSYQLELVKEIVDADDKFARQKLFLYLECVEYGFLYNSGDGQSIFGSKFPSKFFSSTCEEAFGITEEHMIENYERFNIMHGGRRPVVRNAFMTNGEQNPWVEQGIDSEAVHETSTYELVPMRGIHTELSMDIDDPQFAEVRRRASEAIRRWIS